MYETPPLVCLRGLCCPSCCQLGFRFSQPTLCYLMSLTFKAVVCSCRACNCCCIACTSCGEAISALYTNRHLRLSTLSYVQHGVTRLFTSLGDNRMLVRKLPSRPSCATRCAGTCSSRGRARSAPNDPFRETSSKSSPLTYCTTRYCSWTKSSCLRTAPAQLHLSRPQQPLATRFLLWPALRPPLFLLRLRCTTRLLVRESALLLRTQSGCPRGSRCLDPPGVLSLPFHPRSW